MLDKLFAKVKVILELVKDISSDVKEQNVRIELLSQKIEELEKKILKKIEEDKPLGKLEPIVLPDSADAQPWKTPEETTRVVMYGPVPPGDGPQWQIKTNESTPLIDDGSPESYMSDKETIEK